MFWLNQWVAGAQGLRPWAADWNDMSSNPIIELLLLGP